LDTQNQATLESANALQFSKWFPVQFPQSNLKYMCQRQAKNTHFSFLYEESPPCVHWKFRLLNAFDDDPFVTHYFHKIGEILVALNLEKIIFVEPEFFFKIFTFPFSSKLVTIAMTQTLCSNTILQKSSEVSASGPWQAMYSTSLLAPYKKCAILK
jgi:hypothetical protein